MVEESLPGYWEVPATLLIVDPIDDNDQLLAKKMIDGIVEFAEYNVKDTTLERVKAELSIMQELLGGEHLFLLLLCWVPDYKMLLPLTLGNFDLVLKERLTSLISKAVNAAVSMKSDGFQVQRFTKENEDVEALIMTLLKEEMEKVHFDGLRAKDLGYDS